MLDNVRNPIHPTEVFKFIVGTSTGGLIAFGLVGGKNSGGKRQPLTVDEIIEMYKKHTSGIFSKQVKDKHWNHWLLNKVAEGKSLYERIINTAVAADLMLPFHWLLNRVASHLLSFPTEPYSQEGLEKLLKKYFGRIILADIPKPNGCIAGAVARQMFKERPDKMVLFTSGENDCHQVTDILKASADAPIFFQTHVEIFGKKFVDGGVGGNSPLQQALAKVPELFGTTTNIELVVSIAPPKQEIGAIPDKYQWRYWLKWFPNQVSDGSTLYHECKKVFPAISFERLRPESEDAGKFKLNETDVVSMI